MTAYPRAGEPEPITHVLVDDEGTPVSGASVTMRVRRADGLWLDWADGSYGARGAVAQLNEPMAELDEPGTYEATWPGGEGGQRYLVFVEVDGAVRGQLELVVGGLAAPGDPMTLAAGAVDATALAASAVAEVQAGLATSAGLSTLAAAVAAVPASVWAEPEGTPDDGTFGASVQIARKNLDNARTVSTTGGGQEVTYDDDGETPWRTRTLRDGTGGAITTPAGSPARRGAPT